MLRTLSYLNLIFAVAYFLEYLQNGRWPVICGLLAAVLYQWMVLRRLEGGVAKWKVIGWLPAVFTFIFAVYLGSGAVSVALDAMEYQYWPWSSLLLMGAGIVLMLSLIFHLFLSLRVFLAKKDE